MLHTEIWTGGPTTLNTYLFSILFKVFNMSIFFMSGKNDKFPFAQDEIYITRLQYTKTNTFSNMDAQSKQSKCSYNLYHFAMQYVSKNMFSAPLPLRMHIQYQTCQILLYAHIYSHYLHIQIYLLPDFIHSTAKLYILELGP